MTTKGGIEREGLSVNLENLHLRSTAESLLQNSTPLLTPDLSLIADWAQTLPPFPQDQQPIIILDLDDTVWPHVKHLVKAISKASNVPIDMDYYREIGHTRKIPEWQTEKISIIHDQILLNEHPDYLPMVNLAYQDALNTITALKQLNCRLVYLTSRPLETYDLTLKTLALNSLPYAQTKIPPNALQDLTPRADHLYCSPFNVPSGTQYKQTVLNRWLINLDQQDWQNPLIIIDDLLKPFQAIIDQKTVYGISLAGDVNSHARPYLNEVRFPSWSKISQHLFTILSQHQTANQAVIGLD